jgi:prepilin-type N-terminal cleavage/methylation domain-containing protein
MRPLRTQPPHRAGFTLVELLVVITIIAILFALTAAAVFKAKIVADQTAVRNDISQLQNAVQAFKTDFSVSYIPDKLVLPPGNDTTSAQYIASLWPRMTGTSSAGPLSPGTVTFNLSGTNYTPYSYWGVPGNQAIVLQGYQTIVFFLGVAADATGNRVGFSTSPIDPMNTTIGGLGAATRKGPYFDFPTNRLAILPSDTSKSPFPAFIDIYGTMPYLYFSASKAGNDYGTTYPGPTTTTPNPQNGAMSSGMAFAAYPFRISNSRFANANGFQIIAAGRDGIFHDQPASVTTSYVGDARWPGYAGGSTDMGGYDNMSNFHPVLLGIPAQ